MFSVPLAFAYLTIISHLYHLTNKDVKFHSCCALCGCKTLLRKCQMSSLSQIFVLNRRTHPRPCKKGTSAGPFIYFTTEKEKKTACCKVNHCDAAQENILWSDVSACSSVSQT